MASASIPQHADKFLSLLNGVRPTSNGWEARCPCRNDDNNPSLSVALGQDDKVLVTCHRGSGCSVVEICDAVNLKVIDLYPPRPEERKLSLVATYDYRDEKGKLLFQKQRFVDQWGKKTFRQRRPDPANSGKYLYTLDNTPKVLYRLPEVIEAKRTGDLIWLVEGEKDADNMVKLGFCATTPPNGAGKWLDIHTKALEGATVWIISDNDSVGREHGKTVAKTLEKNGCTVISWVPPKNFKDVSELLGSGGTLDDLVELKDAEPIEEELEHEEEEKQTDAIIEATTPLTSLAEQISNLLVREDLSENVRLSKASMLINSFGFEDKVDKGRLVNWSDLVLEEVEDGYDWVIPNVLERGERVIVVAAEGVGKTMLARQIAICSAYGIHPFTMARMKPIRTLTIDLENPEKIIRRSSASIIGASKHLGYLQGAPECHILIKPSGVDLMRASDKAIIEEAVETIRPDLLLLGPIYKSFVDPGGRTSEAVTVEVAKYFDMLRDYYKCALWLEHHAPLGTSSSTRDLRPFGSAVWSRWPEFGLSLTPDPTAVGDYVYDVRHFRGARDVREFPTKMRRGKVFPFEVLEFMKAI
jgi:5S rRNA maturation endonuclease (ribonuclease M5)